MSLPENLRAVSGSRLWKGLLVIWNDVRSYVRIRIGDGNSTDFWRDSWIADGNGNWLWYKFEHLLPLPILLRIAAAGCPMEGFAADSEYWKRKWVRLNLTDAARMVSNPENWDLLFGSVCWNLWLGRNAVVFDNPLEDRGTVLERSRMLMQRCLLAFGSAAPALVVQSRNGTGGHSATDLRLQ
ncbi:hypothetical protein V6N13_057265 [Hibiscus sabdariffa]